MPLRTASDVISCGSLADAVDYAISVSRELEDAERELGTIKRYLRDEGLKLAAQQGDRTTTLRGSLGTAQIVFTKPSPKVRRGADLLEAEKNLPPEVFQRLFSKRVSVEILTGFEEKTHSLTLAQRAVLQKFIRIAPSTPRLVLSA